MKWLLGIIGTAMLIGAFTSGGSSSSEGDGYGALDACHSFVKDQLKSPSTADFTDEDGYDYDEGPWSITGSVDSENGFGATIRSTYTCEVSLDGDTYHGNADVIDGGF